MHMKKVLEDFDAAYNKAFDQGDASGCASFFTENVLLMAPDQPMTRGKKAFEEIYRSRMDKSSGGTHSNNLVEYGVVGTFAITGTNQPSRASSLIF
jgi:ketosteroid isomerase-like protein